MNAIIESVKFVDNKHFTSTEELPLADDRWYCIWLDYMLTLDWYM